MKFWKCRFMTNLSKYPGGEAELTVQLRVTQHAFFIFFLESCRLAKNITMSAVLIVTFLGLAVALTPESLVSVLQPVVDEVSIFHNVCAGVQCM